MSRRIVSARPLGIAALAGRRTGFVQRRCITQADIEDPNMVSLDRDIYLALEITLVMPYSVISAGSSLTDLFCIEWWLH